MFGAMKIATLLTAACLLGSFTFAASAAVNDERLYEMRTYYAAPGKLDDLHARFRNHTMRLFEKHGLVNLGYWVPLENPENKLIYVIAAPSREARDASFKAFGSDPEWKKAQAESEANGKLVAKIEEQFMKATDYSPMIKPGMGGGKRVFELRTYTTTPNNLPLLDSRFRDHTVNLFKKHGMDNLFYWHLAPGQKGAENTLIYILAHETPEMAKKSFDAFRQDPEWTAARKASEEKGGGSLTVPDGVKSVFLQATDYSPTR